MTFDIEIIPHINVSREGEFYALYYVKELNKWVPNKEFLEHLLDILPNGIPHSTLEQIAREEVERIKHAERFYLDELKEIISKPH